MAGTQHIKGEMREAGEAGFHSSSPEHTLRAYSDQSLE